MLSDLSLKNLTPKWSPVIILYILLHKWANWAWLYYFVQQYFFRSYNICLILVLLEYIIYNLSCVWTFESTVWIVSGKPENNMEIQCCCWEVHCRALFTCDDQAILLLCIILWITVLALVSNHSLFISSTSIHQLLTHAFLAHVSHQLPTHICLTSDTSLTHLNP